MSWQRRFHLPLIRETQIAALNPRRGLAVTNLTGVFQLYAWQTESGDLRQLTHTPEGVVFGGISPDGQYIYYLDGGHFVRVPFDGGDAQDITPDLAPYESFVISQSLDGSTIGFTAVDAQGFTIYCLPIAPDNRPGQPQIIIRSAAHTAGPLLSYHAEYAVIVTSEHSTHHDYALLAYSLPGCEEIGRLHEDQGSLRPVAFSPVAGDARLLATTDVTGYERPVIWDVGSGDRIDLPLPDLHGDVSAWGWSPGADRILLVHTHHAHERLYIYDLARSTLNRLSHPAGVFSSGYFVPGTDEIYLNWQDSAHPGQTIALDVQSGKQTRTVLTVSADVPPSKAWQSVVFTSSGGAQVQAWLAVPEGDGPFPAVIHVHDGPRAVQQQVFHPQAQAWLDSGFAWMSVNVRGSSTFGPDFEHAIWGFPGHREIDDMAAAAKWLIDNNVARENTIFAEGRGFGGYLVLQALGRRPDIWAGGIVRDAVADWHLLHEDAAESLRGFQLALFGGAPDDVPEQVRASSPLTYVDAVEAPVLVIQSRQDAPFPARQMRVYIEALQSLDKSVEVSWYDVDEADEVAFMAAKLAFAQQVLRIT